MLASADRDRVSQAIHAAEQTTSGEIVCVLMHAASTYSYAPVLWSAAIAFAAPWLLVAFTALSVVEILSAQIAVFVLAGLALSWAPLRIRLVPRAVKRTRAHRAAMEQFFARGVGRTKNRMGVLIFVALAEHYAHVIADDGIATRVDQTHWQATVDALTGHMAEGRIAEGFIAAIERCGAVLAQHAPPDGEPHVLPNRIYVL